MISTLLATLLAAGPCDPLERTAVDLPLARVYAKVAREEEERGAAEASTTAWRLAAQLEPEGGPAGEALRRLCALEQGEALFDSNDCRAALPLLRQGRGGPSDASVALLEGICAWELSDDAGALAALTAAQADPQLAETAELLLGLLALRQGDSRSALARIQTASRSQSEALRSTASELLRLAGRKDRLVFEAAAEGGYDSNATLTAFPTVLPGGADDGYAAVTAGFTLRPLANNGPFLFVGGGYRKYARFEQADIGLATGTLGWELALAWVRASLDYGLDFVALGAEPWLLRQRGTLRVVLPAGPLLLSGEYVLRHDALLAESARPDSGLRHDGRLGVSTLLGAHTLELAGLVTRVSATTAERSSIEAGGELRWLVRALPRLGLEAGVGLRWRGFDAMDADLLVTRRELQLDALAGADVALTPSLWLFAIVEGRWVASSVPALTFTRVGAAAGLRVWLGVW